MVDFSKLYIMLVKHQPLEAYFCLLYPSEHGNLCSTVPVEGPLSASPFSDEYGGIDLVSPSPYLVRAHILYTPVRVTVSFKCMMYVLSLPTRQNYNACMRS